jgi:hypothetical protein
MGRVSFGSGIKGLRDGAVLLQVVSLCVFASITHMGQGKTLVSA